MARFLKQSTTITLRYGPFLDDTDFKTEETGLAGAMVAEISKAGGAFAARNSATAIAHDANGWYSIELNATDTNTLGSLTLKVDASGHLPVWEHFMVIPANAFDALVSGSGVGVRADVQGWLGTAPATPTVAGVPEVDVTHVGGDAQSATDLKDFADAGYDPATNKVEGVKLADTVTTYTGNTPQTGDAFARLGAPAGASVSADIAAIEAQTDDIGVAGAGLTAVPWNAAWDAEVQSEVADALAVYDPPTHAELVAEIDAVQGDVAGVQSDTNDIQARLPAALVGGRIDSRVGAMATDVVDSGALAESARQEIADETFDRANSIETGLTLRGWLRLAAAVLFGKATGLDAASGTATFRAHGDAKDRVTVDKSSSARTAVTTDAT